MRKKNKLNRKQDEGNLILFCFGEENTKDNFIVNKRANMTDVYFDDVRVSYTPSRLIQSNEYYPFGLQTANSWTRDGNVANSFLANGGTELNSTTALYDLEFRNYDPALGRMHQVDPMASKYSSASTYHYSFNNPVSFTDVNGADPYHTGGLAPSHWSADMAEMSSGNVPHPAPGGFWDAYASGGGGTGFADNNMWDYVGHYNLDGGGYGFGDMYQSGRGGGYVGANRFMNEALQGNGGYWSNGSAVYYSESQMNERVRYYSNMYGMAAIRASNRMGVSALDPLRNRQPTYALLASANNGNSWIFDLQKSDPSWLIKAYGELGVHEADGIANNPRIMEYFSATIYKATSDTYDAWCAAFANWVLKAVGIVGTNTAWAPDFASWGTRLDKPAYGAIGIYNGQHVGFLVGTYPDGSVILLGGNQSDAVGFSKPGVYQVGDFKWVYPSGFTPNYDVPTVSADLRDVYFYMRLGAGGN